MELFKLSDRAYGLVFALLAGGLILASQINRFLLKRYKTEQIINTALISMTIAGLLLMLIVYNNWITLPGMLLMQFIYLSCLGYILPNSSAMAMSPFTKGAGSASALMGALQMGIGAGVSILLSFLQNGTALPMVIVMAICALLALLVLTLGSRMIRYRLSEG
jgi:DHA1 family bicyclomycin/chloramphenicol resistance-like MFS transporter